MEKQFKELRELLLSIDSKHFTWNDARADVLNQLHDLQSKAENLPISGVSSRKVLGFNSCASVVKSMPMDQAIQMIKSDITGKPQTSEIEGKLVVTLM
jgi:hypothetical protein